MLANDVYHCARVCVMDLDLVASLCAWNNDDVFTLHSHVWRNMYNDACHIYRDNTCETYTRECSTIGHELCDTIYLQRDKLTNFAILKKSIMISHVLGSH